MRKVVAVGILALALGGCARTAHDRSVMTGAVIGGAGGAVIGGAASRSVGGAVAGGVIGAVAGGIVGHAVAPRGPCYVRIKGKRKRVRC